MSELIRPIRTRHRIFFWGRKLILQYAYRIPVWPCGSWEVIWKDATIVEKELKEQGE